jgi:hypothetical protein
MADSLVSRRDFLKLAAASALTVAFSAPIDSADKMVISSERENSFSTDLAEYIPFYENHTHRDSDKVIAGSNLNYLFLEAANRTDSILNRGSLEILTSESATPASTFGSELKSTGRFISDNLLFDLEKSKTCIVLEGVEIPEKLDEASDILNISLNYGTPALLLATAGKALRDAYFSKNNYNERQLLNDAKMVIAGSLITIWTASNEIGAAPLSAYKEDVSNPEVVKARELSSRFNAMVSLTHPEDIQVFLRNIFMSLKLISVAEQNQIETTDKPKIGYRIGAAHSAVTDMIQMGRIITTSMLNIYPDTLLWNVIDHNTSLSKPDMSEKIKTFCTTKTIPSDRMLSDQSEQDTIVDTELEKYLTQRLIK